MDDLIYQPVVHNHDSFLKKAKQRAGFQKVYDDLEEEYSIVREMIAARLRLGLSQEDVAQRMGTTKSVISRLEGSGMHYPTIATLKKYAQAIGCHLEIRLVSDHG